MQNSASCFDFMSFFLLNFKINFLCQVQVLYIGFYKYHISVAMCQHIVVFKRFTARTDDSFNLYYLYSNTVFVLPTPVVQRLGSALQSINHCPVV